MRDIRHLAAALGAGAALFLGLAGPAAAETFTVTRTDDPVPGPCMPDDCSLREALNASNASTMVKDVIVIPAAAAHYAIELGLLPVEGPVDVRGAGADRVVLDGDPNEIAVGVGGVGAVLEGLTIAGGNGGIQHNGDELTLRRVAIEHNDRTDGGGGGIQANGSVIVESSFIGFNSTTGTAGAIQANNPLTIVNSTLASNKSQGTAIQANDVTKISSSAIVFNELLDPGGAGVHDLEAVTLADDIVAGNHNPDGTENCVAESGAVLTSLGGNVVDDATCGTGARDRAATPPGLGALELHGGTTPVFSLLPGSAAVDFAVTCPPTDQRGAPRPQGAACDSGPFELEPAPRAPRDETVSLLIGRGKVRVNRKGFGRVRLTCPQGEQSPPCSGVLMLLPKHRPAPPAVASAKLAGAKFRIGAGKTKRVRLHLSARTVNGLRGKPAGRRVLASARVSDAVGNRGQAKRVIRLVTPKPKKKR